MKKTIVALAVLAASGATFAQATISGKLGFSYQKNANVAGGAANHGMQMADGDLNFAATEDLGGGSSITARSAFVSRGRDTAIAARDATLTLVSSVGAFRLGAVETCSKLTEVMSGATSVSTGVDSRLSALDGCSNIDIASYIAPIGPVTAAVSYVEFVPGGGNASTVNAWVLGGTYSAGPLMISADYTTYKGDSKSVTAAAGAVPAYSIGSYADAGTRTRLVGTYDFGVAKLGAGMQAKNKGAAAQYVVSLAVPMGPVTIGIDYASRAAQGAADLDVLGATAAAVVYGTANGDEAKTFMAIGANYALSKTTTLNATYAKHTGAGANTLTNAKAGYNDEYRIRLMKAF